MPLFTAEYGALGSTQPYVADVLRHVARDAARRTHLEIETYTWDVLPGGLKLDLLESIAPRIRMGAADVRAGSEATGRVTVSGSQHGTARRAGAAR